MVVTNTTEVCSSHYCILIGATYTIFGDLHIKYVLTTHDLPATYHSGEHTGSLAHLHRDFFSNFGGAHLEHYVWCAGNTTSEMK